MLSYFIDMIIVGVNKYNKGGTLATKELNKDIILKKIQKMANLPSPNPAIMNIVSLFSDEDVNIYHVVEEIEKDQTLVAKILKLVNSGYYSLRNTVDSLERAVTLLGLLNIKQLVYSAAVMDMYGKNDVDEWKHSYSTFVLMGNIIREKNLSVNSQLPLTMLMHDIGKVVLRQISKKLYKQVPELVKNKRMTSCAAEELIFKVNHCDVGALLLEKWEMASSIVEPIRAHHNYDKMPKDYIVETALLQFVDWVDLSARDYDSLTPPSKKLLAKAELESLDSDFWIRYQKDLIELLDDDEED